MRNLLLAIVLLGCASVSFGGVDFTWNLDSSTAGIDVYTLGILGEEGPAGWNIDVIFATDGVFVQSLYNGAMDVNTNTLATGLDGNSDYVKHLDCWYYDNTWSEVAPNSTNVAGTTQLILSSLGSKSGATFSSAEVMQVAVTSGSQINWSGVVSYAGHDYNVVGSIPEPTSLSLLSMSVFALWRRRK